MCTPRVFDTLVSLTVSLILSSILDTAKRMAVNGSSCGDLMYHILQEILMTVMFDSDSKAQIISFLLCAKSDKCNVIVAVKYLRSIGALSSCMCSSVMCTPRVFLVVSLEP